MFDMKEIRFDERGLVPAIAQDAKTGAVLMLAYMNAESLQLTLDTGFATYYSRSRQALWKKGETSGHTQRVLELHYDCDGDAILMKVEQTGPACHTGEYSCFHHPVIAMEDWEKPATAKVLEEDYAVIADRSIHPQEGSYTNYLLTNGVEKICKKVGEEASETIIAAMKGNSEEVTYEVADLLYHLMVLMFQQGVTWDDVYAELLRRR